MREEPTSVNPEAVRAAFELAFANPRSPLSYETSTDSELQPRVRRGAPAASPEECLGALAMVRRLCDDIYKICGDFRDGKFGKGDSARAAAVRQLAVRNPGFTAGDYEAAFSAGLLWTAF